MRPTVAPERAEQRGSYSPRQHVRSAWSLCAACQHRGTGSHVTDKVGSHRGHGDNAPHAGRRIPWPPWKRQRAVEASRVAAAPKAAAEAQLRSHLATLRRAAQETAASAAIGSQRDLAAAIALTTALRSARAHSDAPRFTRFETLNVTTTITTTILNFTHKPARKYFTKSCLR